MGRDVGYDDGIFVVGELVGLFVMYGVGLSVLDIEGDSVLESPSTPQKIVLPMFSERVLKELKFIIHDIMFVMSFP